MNIRHESAAAFAVAAVILGIGGGIAATQLISKASPPAPAVYSPPTGPAADPPEPGDIPDGP